MHNIAKLNPQGNVHAEQLYAALNTIRRLATRFDAFRRCF